MQYRAITILALSLCLWAVPGESAELSGRIEIKGVSQGRRMAEAMEGAVVYFEPESAVKAKPQPRAEEMTTRQISFQPRVMAINPGTTVRFPNEDTILHNVFSVSPGNTFDLGFYRRGDGKSWTFDEPGLVRVFCNVHYSMAANILVLETPYFTKPDPDGSFRLEGLPAGKGRLRVWQDQSRPWSLEVEVPAQQPVVASLQKSRKRIEPHLNKHGEPYKRGGRDEDYR